MANLNFCISYETVLLLSNIKSGRQQQVQVVIEISLVVPMVITHLFRHRKRPPGPSLILILTILGNKTQVEYFVYKGVIL
jgi:hypothetical protein